MPNRLAGEKSPYLLQHANNPVDWRPWGHEALSEAQSRDIPILVSIGYSACHWCHVMERESFEDEATARLMNEYFVNIKVDREERPDVDAVYMEAVQALSGQGGWPLNVFLTPDGRPFFGGTYFPPSARQGLVSWRDLLVSVSHAYRDRREDVLHNADALTAHVRQAQAPVRTPDADLRVVPEVAYRRASAQLDWDRGGFGNAPKFPQPLGLEFMLRMWRRLNEPVALDFVRLSLDRMAAGGLFDQLGGGFHRYSVDSEWVVSHFEKMLYDNALLLRTYLHAFQATGAPTYRQIAISTADYLLRDLLAPEGAFWSAEDADSEGVEGKFYVWTPAEIEGLLGEDAGIFSLRYGVTPDGNFEGSTILTAAMTVEEVASEAKLEASEVERRLERSKATMLAARSQRTRPATDTKILTSWNGLAIAALAEAGRALHRLDYVRAAERAARFVLAEMRQGGGLVRSWKDGPSAIGGFLEDYAFMIDGLVTLYESAFDRRYLRDAEAVAEEMATRFRDPETGDFFDTAVDADPLVVRPRGLFDNPIPSGNSAASFGLLRLYSLTGNDRYREWAVPVFHQVSDFMARAPLGFSHLLAALDFYLSTPLQIAVALGQPGDADGMTQPIFGRYLPNRVIAVGRTGEVPLLDGREAINGRSTAYVCQAFACRLPVTDPDGLSAQLDSISSRVASQS